MVVFMKKLIIASFIAVSLSASMQAILAVENDSSLQTLSIVSVDKPTPALSANVSVNIEKRDTNLIPAVVKAPLVEANKYKEKVSKDKKEFQKVNKKLKQEHYCLAEIFDRLIRANNLQYQNWRFAITLDAESVNAHAGSANLIVINSSLYDSLYPNEDAIAFVLAHELSHLILKHNQLSAENFVKISKYQKEIAELEREISRQNTIGSVNSALKNYNAAAANAGANFANGFAKGVLEAKIEHIYEQERKLEFIADSEALVLMTRAGFNPEKAQDAMDFLSNLPHVEDAKNTHPSFDDRMLNLEEDLFLNDEENYKNQGRKNILDSKVLIVKKSKDKKTIILYRDEKFDRTEYVQLSKEDKLIQKAYEYYKIDDYENAKAYFLKANKENSKNVIPPLYLSYIEEYNFIQNPQKTTFKQAKLWLKQARRIDSDNEYVKKQKTDLKATLIAIKKSKKVSKSE